MENILLETLGLTIEEFQKGLEEFYQKKHLEELPNQKPLLERMIEQSGKNLKILLKKITY